MNESIPCDIVVTPSAELAQRAILLSQRMGGLYVLEDGAFYPHISLYMTQLKVADLERVASILSTIAQDTPTIKLEAVGYDQAEGYIDADYRRVSVLDHLQTLVLDKINPVRDGMRAKDKARMQEATGQARENLEKYGYRGVGELFRPHMSFTRFSGREPIDTSSLPAPSEFSGSFTHIGLFAMGDNGTCTRKIVEFKLDH